MAVQNLGKRADLSPAALAMPPPHNPLAGAGLSPFLLWWQGQVAIRLDYRYISLISMLM